MAAVSFPQQTTHIQVQLSHAHINHLTESKSFILFITDKAGVCVNALETSQRSIFVLTEDIFLEDWNLYCLDVALQEHRKIIIIKRQEIDFDQLLGV